MGTLGFLSAEPLYAFLPLGSQVFSMEYVVSARRVAGPLTHAGMRFKLKRSL